MQVETRIQMAAGATLALSVALSGTIAVAATAIAGRAQLGYADTAEEGAPPEVALGIAMGAFRGLFVNALWIRAAKMKQEGKFYEALELRRAITRLQPRFPRVWAYQAWDMAYNISVQVPTAEERWEWVSAGVNLLRSEGIPSNPNDTWLHKELAWIFNHKIQGFADDANPHYKRELAREWTYILGVDWPRQPTPEDADVQEIWSEMLSRGAEGGAGSDTGGGGEGDAESDAGPPSMRDALRLADTARKIAHLENIRGAAATLDELYEVHPAARGIVRRLKERAQLDPDLGLLRVHTMRYAFSRSLIGRELDVSLSGRFRNEGYDSVIAELSGEGDEVVEAFRALLLFVRKQVIREDMRMELSRMIRYTRIYGPLDWRHASAHGVYWAVRGVESGVERVNTEDFDMINTDRVVLQSLQELFRWGEVYYSVLDNRFVSMPDMDFIDAYTRVLELLNERADPLNQMGERAVTLYASGYMNFLRDVVRVLYRRGEIAEAERYYEKLRTLDTRNINDFRTVQMLELSLPLEEFVRLDIEERIEAPDFATQEVYDSLRGAFVNGLLRGDTAAYIAGIEWADFAHGRYMAKQNLTTTTDAQNRMLVMSPIFADAVAQAFAQLLAAGDIGVEQAMTIYRRAPVGLQLIAYDLLVQLREEGDALFDRKFPPPPGLDDYRAQRAEMAQRDPARLKEMLRFSPQ